MPVTELDARPSVIFLLGPTASGKTALALKLADRFPLGIISVDSALVYRGMDIGTAKPDSVTLARYPHHLINLIEPTEAYSAARFCSDAHEAIGQVTSQGKIPLLVGGTMLVFEGAARWIERVAAAPTRRFARDWN